EIAEPFICHSTSDPVVLCRHSTSASPSPLKSPTPTTLHDESGATVLPMEVTKALEAIAEPFISQVTSEPVVLCRHSRSASPSPLKSPTPATLHVESGVTALPLEVTKTLEAAEPFISHVTNDSVVLCRHSTSASPSPLKSPMPATLQVESGVTVLPPMV